MFLMKRIQIGINLSGRTERISTVQPVNQSIFYFYFLFSYQEFVDQTKRQEFQQDEGWDPIDNQSHPVYSQDEYKAYAKQHEEEIRRMIDQGLVKSNF